MHPCTRAPPRTHQHPRNPVQVLVWAHPPMHADTHAGLLPTALTHTPPTLFAISPQSPESAAEAEGALGLQGSGEAVWGLQGICTHA